MLTDAAIKALKPKDKIYKVADRYGMYVRVMPGGTVSFRLDYRLNGRRETVYLGRYGRDGISLARAGGTTKDHGVLIIQEPDHLIEICRRDEVFEVRRTGKKAAMGTHGREKIVMGPYAGGAPSGAALRFEAQLFEELLLLDFGYMQQVRHQLADVGGELLLGEFPPDRYATFRRSFQRGMQAGRKLALSDISSKPWTSSPLATPAASALVTRR